MGKTVLMKWNAEEKEYEPYEVPEDWNVAIYSNDLDKMIDCAGCGKEIKFGDGYTSMEIHNFVGFGFIVCGDCHWGEIKRVYRREK